MLLLELVSVSVAFLSSISICLSYTTIFILYFESYCTLSVCFIPCRSLGAIVLGVTIEVEGGVSPLGWNAHFQGPVSPYSFNRYWYVIYGH